MIPANEIPVPAAPDIEVDAPAATPSTDTLIDVRQISDFVAFVRRAIRRHQSAAVAIFVVVVAATFGILKVWPKTYHVQAKVLTQRNDLMASISNPGRVIPPDADNPTRAVSEIILGRTNVLSLIKQTDLLSGWERTRPPVLRLKDRVVQSVLGRPSDSDRLDALVGTLEQQIKVSVTQEGTIAIDIDWRDGQTAYRLVEAAMQNLLESRRVAEESAISASIGILEASAASVQAEIDRAVSDLQAMLATRPQPTRARAPRPTPAPTLAVASASPAAVAQAEEAIASPAPEVLFELARLKSDIENKHHEITKIEDQRRQRLSELQARLAAGLTMYTENHPAVVSLREGIAKLADEPSELVALRQQARNLETQYDALITATPAKARKTDETRQTQTQKPSATQQAPARALEPQPIMAPSPTLGADADVSDALNPVTLRLRLALGQLGNLRDRINGAKIELAAAEASFQARYTMLRPAEVPKRPTKPNAIAVLGTGIVGALVLAIVAAVGLDLVRGRIVDVWQLERQLGVPALIRKS